MWTLEKTLREHSIWSFSKHHGNATFKQSETSLKNIKYLKNVRQTGENIQMLLFNMIKWNIPLMF